MGQMPRPIEEVMMLSMVWTRAAMSAGRWSVVDIQVGNDSIGVVTAGGNVSKLDSTAHAGSALAIMGTRMPLRNTGAPVMARSTLLLARR